MLEQVNGGVKREDVQQADTAQNIAETLQFAIGESIIDLTEMSKIRSVRGYKCMF